MIKNPDIISNVASIIKNRPFVVKFYTETNNLKQYAK